MATSCRDFARGVRPCFRNIAQPESSKCPPSAVHIRGSALSSFLVNSAGLHPALPEYSAVGCRFRAADARFPQIHPEERSEAELRWTSTLSFQIPARKNHSGCKQDNCAIHHCIRRVMENQRTRYRAAVCGGGGHVEVFEVRQNVRYPREKCLREWIQFAAAQISHLCDE